MRSLCRERGDGMHREQGNNPGAALAIFGSADFAGAQQPKTHVIGFSNRDVGLLDGSPRGRFRQGLRELGYVEGQNITIEYRWADGKEERLSDFAAELVRLKVDVLASHGVLATQAAKRASSTTTDCVLCMWRCSVGRTGGQPCSAGWQHHRADGAAPEVSGKRIELLKEVVPRLSRLAVSGIPTSRVQTRVEEAEAAADPRWIAVAIRQCDKSQRFRTRLQFDEGGARTGPYRVV